ncbi:MAG: D-glycerate dehydrogenase [Pedobacter sp.]|nr:MAG: D-glycerate dehydrogenase [Pedobacter sp.]
MKVLVTKRIPQSGIELLKSAGHSITIYNQEKKATQDELIQLCQSQDALLVVGHNQLNSNFFESCSHLKAVALMSAGYDHVDVAAATRYGIPISNITDVLSKATSDVAFLLMLSVSRNAFNRHKAIEKGEWKFFDSTANLGIELYGKTLGILGLGRIGVELAKKAAAAFEMKIIYHNRSRNSSAEDQLNAEYVTFDELLKRSDVLSVHTILSEQTKEIFNRTAFQKMKPTSIFINTARGPIHHEGDLIEALNTKTIWGAGLDVTSPEPMSKDNPLLNLPNVCVLPHIGSATEETRTKMSAMAAQNLICALKGKKMPQILNPEVYL